MKYLGEFAVRPQLEMLIKLGMDNIVSGLLFGRGPSGLNWKAKTPWGLMRLTKADWKLYMERQDIDRLPYIKKLMQTTGADFKTAEALVQGVSYRTMEFCSVLAEALKQTGESARRAQMWFGKQKRSCIYWLDYIGMAKKMGYDLTQERVAFPKDLEEAHDRVAAQVKWEEDRALEAKYAPRYERLKRVYNYTADGLEVVVPKSQSEIIAEGAALQHCVGGYARRHMEGSNTILFIRRTDALQTPFLTVQVDGERIIQVHGFRNDRGGRPAEVEYKAFLDGWLMDVHRRGVMA